MCVCYVFVGGGAYVRRVQAGERGTEVGEK